MQPLGFGPVGDEVGVGHCVPGDPDAPGLADEVAVPPGEPVPDALDVAPGLPVLVEVAAGLPVDVDVVVGLPLDVAVALEVCCWSWMPAGRAPPAAVALPLALGEPPVVPEADGEPAEVPDGEPAAVGVDEGVLPGLEVFVPDCVGHGFEPT